MSLQQCEDCKVFTGARGVAFGEPLDRVRRWCMQCAHNAHPLAVEVVSKRCKHLGYRKHNWGRGAGGSSNLGIFKAKPKTIL